MQDSHHKSQLGKHHKAAQRGAKSYRSDGQRSRESTRDAARQAKHTVQRSGNLARNCNSTSSNTLESHNDDTMAPQSQSPSSQNISYHHQQQMHQHQIQRTGGLQRLTADLVGLQFIDSEAIFKTSPRARSQRVQIASGKIAGAGKSSKQAEAASMISAAVAVVAAAQSEAHRADNQAASEHGQHGYEEQMTEPSGGSAEHEFDPAKDAAETAEDAAALKRYKILNLVGTGNYARVYKATSPNGRELAIKAINLAKTSDNYKTRFLPRELTILRKISHVNICKVHEIMQVADRVFIVMQFCARGTIADLLHKHGPLSEPIIRNLFVQIVDAVSYLHSNDVAHRDLKVENILLDNEFCPKLTDFSYSINLADKQLYVKSSIKPSSGKLVQFRGSIRLNDTFCGTLPYLSPEMIRQLPYDSKKTDVWSLGICLFVMLNDRLPFPFNDIKLMVKRQLTKDYKFRVNIEYSDQVRDLVSAMLEPEYQKRTTAQEISRHPWLSGTKEKPPG